MAKKPSTYAVAINNNQRAFDLVGESDGDLKTRTYNHGMLRAGKFTHPTTKQAIDISDWKLKQFAKTAKQMETNGVRIPIVKAHGFPKYAEFENDQVLGYVSDFFINSDGWLDGNYEFRGENALQEALRIGQVSVGIEGEFTDADGNVYKDAISHVAVTSTPVITQQKDFKIAASNKGIGSDFVVFSYVGEKSMSDIKDLIKELFPDTDIEDGKESEFIISQVQALRASNQDQKKQLSLSQTKVKELEECVVVDTDPDVTEDRAVMLDELIDHKLVDTARINKTFAGSLKSLILGEAETRNTYALSTKRSGKDGKVTYFAKQVIDLLSTLPPRVEFGIQSGPQTAVLDTKNREGTKDFDPEVSKKMLSYVS